MLPEQPRRNTLTDPPKIDFEDPIIDSFFFDTWGAIAKKNTKIYEEVSFLFYFNFDRLSVFFVMESFCLLFFRYFMFTQLTLLKLSKI